MWSPSGHQGCYKAVVKTVHDFDETTTVVLHVDDPKWLLRPHAAAYPKEVRADRNTVREPFQEELRSLRKRLEHARSDGKVGVHVQTDVLETLLCAGESLFEIIKGTY